MRHAAWTLMIVFVIGCEQQSQSPAPRPAPASPAPASVPPPPPPPPQAPAAAASSGTIDWESAGSGETSEGARFYAKATALNNHIADELAKVQTAVSAGQVAPRLQPLIDRSNEMSEKEQPGVLRGMSSEERQRVFKEYVPQARKAARRALDQRLRLTRDPELWKAWRAALRGNAGS